MKGILTRLSVQNKKEWIIYYVKIASSSMKNIAITLDKNYCIHSAVMLHSLLCNNNPSEIYVHIILNFENYLFKIPLIYILEKKKCRYEFYHIKENTIEYAEDLIITHHVTIATYFRLFLPSILKDVDKVLFLDSDMVIDGNIDELFAVDIHQHTHAAVFQNSKERVSTLGLSQGYFNAGVLLLNLDFLRANNYELKFKAFIKNNKDKVIYWDQDVLNAVTQGHIIPLSEQWNWLANDDKCEIKPIIIHYAGRHKPWDHYYKRLIKAKYLEYLHKDKFLSVLNILMNTYSYVKTIISKIF